MSDSSDGCGYSGCIGTIIALVIINALISALSSVFAFIMEYWYVILIITVIVGVLIVKIASSVTSSEEYQKAEKKRLKKEKLLKLQEDKEFRKFFPNVEDMYNGVMSVLTEREDSAYLEYVQDLYLKNRELFTKSKEIIGKAEKTKKLVAELEMQLAKTQENNEKNNLSEKHLEKAKSRFEEYKKYLETIKETINGTAQDFLNVKGNLMLGESEASNNFEQMDNTLNSLKAKSDTINYVLNNMPNYD